MKQKDVVVTMDSHLIEGKLLDSLDFMDYVFQVQEFYELEISDGDLEKRRLGNMRNMVNYVVERTSC